MLTAPVTILLGAASFEEISKALASLVSGWRLMPKEDALWCAETPIGNVVAGESLYEDDLIEASKYAARVRVIPDSRVDRAAVIAQFESALRSLNTPMLTVADDLETVLGTWTPPARAGE